MKSHFFNAELSEGFNTIQNEKSPDPHGLSGDFTKNLKRF